MQQKTMPDRDTSFDNNYHIPLSTGHLRKNKEKVCFDIAMSFRHRCFINWLFLRNWISRRALAWMCICYVRTEVKINNTEIDTWSTILTKEKSSALFGSLIVYDVILQRVQQFMVPCRCALFVYDSPFFYLKYSVWSKTKWYFPILVKLIILYS